MHSAAVAYGQTCCARLHHEKKNVEGHFKFAAQHLDESVKYSI